MLAYAAQLRERAEQARVRDPNADLYAPTKDAASRLCSEMTGRVGKEDGPAAAIVELARRARLRELKVEEEGAHASARRSAHRLHLLRSAGEREADVSRLSLGERLDMALMGLGLVSEASAARAFDEQDRVTGSKSAGSGLPRVDDRHGDLEVQVLRLVERAEREAQRARRQLVETEGSAA